MLGEYARTELRPQISSFSFWDGGLTELLKLALNSLLPR